MWKAIPSKTAHLCQAPSKVFWTFSSLYVQSLSEDKNKATAFTVQQLPPALNISIFKVNSTYRLSKLKMTNMIHWMTKNDLDSFNNNNNNNLNANCILIYIQIIWQNC
jgi:hypothetical protein